MAPPLSSPSAPPGAPEDDAPSSPRSVLFEDQRVPLRLTASHGALGLELYEPVEIGPLTVTALSLTLPGLKFPLDLSGGVPKFRHRRGELEHVEVEVELERLARFSAQRAQGAFTGARGPELWTVPGGVGVGLLGAEHAVAFDLLWAPDHADARLVVANARGSGLDVPALAFALRALDTVLGSDVRRAGRVLRLARAGERIARLLLPAVGARAPRADHVRFAGLVVGERKLRLVLDASLPPTEYSVEAARALELAELVRDADDALAAGHAEAARTQYVNALERAPRHPELVRLVAEIDARVGGRAEAALGLLVESLPATHAGLVGAELLARVGDAAGARQAVEEACRGEPFAPLAALSWLRLAALDPEPPVRALALDRAVAQAPGLSAARWARFRARVERGDATGAIADAEHLEAIARGARARHEICRDAARRLLDAGYVVDAGKLFERALRYLPDDPAATLGLARALVEAGRPRRALPLLERGLELSERTGRLDAEALLDLARVLADELGDLPQAIARVRQVSASSERIVEARRLEATWRARLGDRVGAALAYGRLREAVELASAPKPVWAAWLAEAADDALRVEDDVLAAERHLAVALRIAPQDPALAERYRAVAARVAERVRGGR